MTTRFMTDPDQMRAMAGRFDAHAQTVQDEALKMWASSQNIAGAGWSGQTASSGLSATATSSPPAWATTWRSRFTASGVWSQGS